MNTFFRNVKTSGR